MALHHWPESQARRNGAEVLRGAKGCGEERGVGRSRKVSQSIRPEDRLAHRNGITQQSSGASVHLPPRNRIRLDMAGPSANGAARAG
jgi:hypothetical protein